MKAIKKLELTTKIAIILIMIPLLVAFFEINPGWIISIGVILVLSILSRFVFFRDKNTKSHLQDFNIFKVCVYFIFGFLLLLFAGIFTIETILDIIQRDFIPFWWRLIILGFWIFGTLIIYYDYQAKKELSLKGKLTTKEKSEKKKIKKFNANYLITFYILLTIIGFIFGTFSLTLKNIFVCIFILIAMYFLLRKFS